MQTIEQQIFELESQLTGSLIEDTLIRERIYHLKRKSVTEDIIVCSMEDGCLNCGS